MNPPGTPTPQEHAETIQRHLQLEREQYQELQGRLRAQQEHQEKLMAAQQEAQARLAQAQRKLFAQQQETRRLQEQQDEDMAKAEELRQRQRQQRKEMEESPHDEATLLRAILSNLLEAHLYSSAEVVGSVLLCRVGTKRGTGGVGGTSGPAGGGEEGGGGGGGGGVTRAEALSLYADALKGQGELKRATTYYKHALQQRKLTSKGTSKLGTSSRVGGPNALLTSANKRVATNPASSSSSSRMEDGDADMSMLSSQSPAAAAGSSSSSSSSSGGGGGDGTGGAGSGRSNSIGGSSAGGGRSPNARIGWQRAYIEEAEIKFKEAQCLVAAGESGAAISSLESVLLFARTVEMNVCLAKTYEGAGLRRNAANVYKHALRQSPLAVEVIMPMLSMGVPKKDIMDIISTHMSNVPLTPKLEHVPWIGSIVEGFAALLSNNSLEALETFSLAESEYPTLLLVLQGMGRAYMDLDRWDDAQYAFGKARIVDDQILDSMDMLAYVLFKKQDLGALNRLAHELLAIDCHRTEPWIACALCTELKGDTSPARSLVFAEKAIELSSKHPLAHLVMGELQMARGKFEHAHLSFFTASAQQKCIRSSRGLVEAYLGINKLCDAAAAAKEALTSMPKSPGAVILMGRVLAKAPQHHVKDGGERAKKAFKKALLLDPMNLEATLALSDCYILSAEYELCTNILQAALQSHNDEVLHLKLAKVFTLRLMYQDAIGYYHLAAGLNPSSSEAAEGLENLERLMRRDNETRQAKGLDVNVNTSDEEEEGRGGGGRQRDSDDEDDDFEQSGTGTVRRGEEGGSSRMSSAASGQSVGGGRAHADDMEVGGWQ